MIILFDRKHSTLSVIVKSLLGQDYLRKMVFDAANNADSRSKGPWPDGIYTSTSLVEVPGPDGAHNGKFGRWFLKFDGVPGRTGMGIHAGRRDSVDKAGRVGAHFATMGCIRTTEHAMEFISLHFDHDSPAQLWVL